MQRWIGLLAALLIGGCAATVNPTSAGAAVPATDTPPLIAGRLAAVEGDVRIWRGEENTSGSWDRAELNDVITAGVGLATDNGRAEVRVGPHAFRLGAGSSGGFSQLDFAVKAFDLERGALNVRLAAAQQGESVSVLIAGVQVDLAAPGRYRIDAIDGSPLNISVFEGHGNVRYGGNTVSVSRGKALIMTQSNMNFATAVSTELDAWAFARDERYQQLPSERYVSPYMTGYEELDAYGDWMADGAYGTVWVPRAVPVGWAPYRDGRWRWVAPWGWTWVDASPWGYAPFHYGRWVTVGGRWCWWPGRYVARPVWAPALVGFIGTGGASVSVGVGGPAVGWYPLAPWHPYRPYYRANNTYVTVINQTVIQRPPAGVPHDVTQRPGSTWVPQQRFHEPVAKVRLPARTAPVADLQPVAPPPRPVRTGPVTDDVRGGVPAGRVAPPHVRGAQGVAQTSPKFTTTEPQPIPGADGTISQPAPIRGPEPGVVAPAPAPRREVEAPRSKPRVQPELLPPYQQLQTPNPAEPARVPPAAPPTIRQPAVGSAPIAPRGVVAQPAPASPVAVAPVPRAAPPAHTPHTPPAPASPVAAAPVPRAAAPARTPHTPGAPANPVAAVPTHTPHTPPPAGQAPAQVPATSKQDVPTQASNASAPKPDIPRPKMNVMER